MELETVGTTTCPECGGTVRVFRRSFRDPSTGRAIFAVSLHFLDGGSMCRGQGKRVNPDQITRGESK
jgi:hypothetical protein